MQYQVYVAFLMNAFSKVLKLNDEDSLNDIAILLFNENADRVAPLDLVNKFRYFLCKKVFVFVLIIWSQSFYVR